MKHKLLILLCLLFSTACVSKHNIVSSQRPAAKLSSQSSLFVAIPERATYGNKIYRDSGNITAEILASIFAQRARRVALANGVHSLADAISAARSTGSKYLVLPKILHWEDRATKWSSIPDKVIIRITIIQVDNQTTVAESTIDGRSEIVSFVGGHPQDLLPKPFAEFVNSLY